MEAKSSADWDGRDMIGQPEPSLTDPEPTFTDEELAAMERGRWRFGSLTGPQCDRLIAALRAERAEVEELKAQIDEYRFYLHD